MCIRATTGESGGRLGETKKLPLTARASSRRRGIGEFAAGSLNSLVWESCELHTAVFPGKKAENKVGMAEKWRWQQLVIISHGCKIRG